MKRLVLITLLACVLIRAAAVLCAECSPALDGCHASSDTARRVAVQWYGPQADCPSGQCPIVVRPLPAAPPAPPVAPAVALPSGSRAAIVRIECTRGGSRSLGTGTLIDVEGQRGLIVTCAHLFGEGAGTIRASFPNGQGYAADLARIDQAADLAALWIKEPDASPVEIARQYPERGDPLVSCGYGSDGRLWCNRGKTLGYVSTSGARGTETLELSGTARFGDSGGPVFNERYELVAVLFGTNGRVVDGTFCGRVRRFLAGLSPRFRAPKPAAPSPPLPAADPAAEAEPPTAETPPAPAPPKDPPPAAAQESRLAKLEGLIAHLNEAWQGVSARLDRVVKAVESVKAGLPDKRGDVPLAPPQVELPAGADPVSTIDPIAEAARPWLSAKLAALLVSFGLPAGVAGLIAAAVVYLAMRRGRQRLQAEVDRLQGRASGAPGQPAPGEAANTAAETPIIRHHNQYVPFEVTALDKAWSAAHAHISEKYPGAVPYLKMVEGVKDQLLSGNSEPTDLEGRTL